MERTYGFRLLDDSRYRRRFESELRQIGYSLGDYHADETLLRELDVPFEPLGKAQRLCLRLTQDAYQDWAYGSLFAVDFPEDVMAEFDFDPRIHYAKSCYDVWLESILDAVRRSTKP